MEYGYGDGVAITHHVTNVKLRFYGFRVKVLLKHFYPSALGENARIVLEI